MNIFETVKAAVTVRQAAEHYGLKINRSGMICCPFHDDRHPSLKLNEDYFYCFGCGAKGDVIDFVARLLDLSAYEAAQRLAADFGLDRPPSVVAQVKKYRPRVNQSKQDELFCMNVLSGYTPKPVLWLSFLNGLLYPEDIPTLQEFIGYCLIPSNKGQRMMVIKGNGGEGKSQIGAVLGQMLGSSMKDGSIGKISENRFARADLEHILLCVDDDMRMEALRQTNYVKSMATQRSITERAG